CAFDGGCGPLATTAARLDAVLSQKPRILHWVVDTSTSDGPDQVTVTYRGLSPKVYFDRLPLWSLPDMAAFLRALRARSGTTRRPAAAPALDLDSVCALCPALWWSLSLWAISALAETTTPTTTTTEPPAAARGKKAALRAWPPQPQQLPAAMPV
ncbi:unnamed protein product, partial [Polarella glacialis]